MSDRENKSTSRNISVAAMMDWTGQVDYVLQASDFDALRKPCALYEYAAAREKDLIFTRELVRRGIVAEERLLLLLGQTRVDKEVRNRIRDKIAADFQAARDRDSIREREPAITQQSVAALHGADELETIKARGREEWLKVRGQANTQSRPRKPTRTRDLESRNCLERDSDKSLDDDDSE